VVPAGSPIAVPRDDAAHAAPGAEVWTWMGYVTTASGRRLAFSLDDATGAAGGPLPFQEMGANLTDLQAHRFMYARTPSFQGVAPGAGRFALRAGQQSAGGGGGRDHLHFAVDGYVLDLRLRNVGPLVVDYDNGVWRMDPLQVNYSFDRILMQVRGTLRRGSRTVPVRGFADYGKFWGPSSAVLTANWDFMYFRLDDGRLIQVWQARRGRGEPVKWWTGQLVGRGCRATKLGRRDFTITPTGHWTRDDGCTYPMGWIVQVRGLRMVVRPSVLDQEARGAPITLWRGAVTVSGAADGRGFVELVNYCEN
jgi:predicted secreted hydrolase